MAKSQEGIKKEVTVWNCLLSIVAEKELKKAWSGKTVLFVELCCWIGILSHEWGDLTGGKWGFD